MAVWDTLATTAAGVAFATAGILAGGMVTHRAQDRQWLRDKQLAAYEDLLLEGLRSRLDPNKRPAPASTRRADAPARPST